MHDDIGFAQGVVTHADDAFSDKSPCFGVELHRFTSTKCSGSPYDADGKQTATVTLKRLSGTLIHDERSFSRQGEGNPGLSGRKSFATGPNGCAQANLFAQDALNDSIFSGRSNHRRDARPLRHARGSHLGGHAPRTDTRR